MSKPLWIFLLLVTGALALWRGGGAWIAYSEYARHADEVQANILNWKIIPKGGRYGIQAEFSYTYNEKKYTCRMLMPKPYHLNKLSAESEVQKIVGMKWTAWVDAKVPRKALLLKKFPFIQILYGVILTGVFLYFLYLKFHVELLSRSM